MVVKNIAMSIDYRGNNDDVLTLMFAGISMETLQRTFCFLCGSGSGIARGFSISEGCSPVWRMGYVNEWLEVTLQDRNDLFTTIDDMLLLIESAVARHAQGRVDRYPLTDFLNLLHRNERRIIATVPAVSPAEKTVPETTAAILRDFPTTPTRTLAARYGRSISAINTMAHRRGVTKTRWS